MEFSIKFDTVKSGWSIVYIEGSQVIVSKKYYKEHGCSVVECLTRDPCADPEGRGTGCTDPPPP